MSNDETCNGWTNWETWNVNLWLTNDEGAQSWLQCLADDADDANALADTLKQEVPESEIVGDELSWHRVNWHEIAAAALEE